MPDAGAPPLLDIDVRRKSYVDARHGTIEVVDGLRFELARGTVTCLVGPSGCGKTTALRIIMGLDRDFQGSITPPLGALRIGAVFQDPRLLPWRTVEQNIRLAAPDARSSEVEDILVATDLAAWRHHRPAEISVGMARRVALARALCVKPDVLILDESFVSLDERGADLMRTFVFDTALANGAAILSVTHNLREALKSADILLVLAGRPTCVKRRLVYQHRPCDRSEAWIEGERLRLIGDIPATDDASLAEERDKT